MANETTRTSANDAVLNAEIDARVLHAVRAATVMAPLVYTKNLSADATALASTFARWDAISAAALSEASDTSNTQVTQSGVTITAAQISVMVKPTDLVRKTSVYGIADGPWIEQIGRALADKFDDDLCALLASFSSTVGTSGADLTLNQFLTAIYTLENANAPHGNPSEPTSYGPTPSGLQGPIAVLHPIQSFDLRSAVSASSAAWFGADVNNADVLFKDGSKPSGYVGKLFGVPIFQSSNVDTANAAADRAGAMFTPSSLGALIKWMGMVETDRDISMLSTEIVGSSCYGVGELLDAGGVSIITDA